MASPKKPNPNLPVDDEIDLNANSSPQPPAQPAAPNEEDTPMAETSNPPLPPPPPAQPSNIPQVGQDVLSQLSMEDLATVAQRQGLPVPPSTFLQQAVPQPAYPQPVVSQPVVSQPVISRQQPQAQTGQTQHMPMPGTAGPPNSIYTCPNCQRRGHPLRECPGPPDRFGYIPGCPKCHKLDHTLAQCPKGFTLQDVFHYIFSSRRNNFPMIWDTDLLAPEMATFLSEAQPWTQGFARQQMAQHLARDWDWHPEGIVPDPAWDSWNLNDRIPPQIHPQAPAKVSSFTPAEMREWKECRLETARRKNEVDRVSGPSGQHAGGRASSGFRGPARNQPGGQRARGPDPLRRVNNNRRPRVGKPGKPSKPRATDNAESKLLDKFCDTIKLIATTSNVGGSQDPRARSLVHERSLPSRSLSPETVVDNPRGNRAASPAASQYGDRRVPSWLASRYDDLATFARPASPTGAHDLRGVRRAPSLTRSRFDDPGRRAPSPARSRYDDPGRRSASPARSRYDDPGRRSASPTGSRFGDPGHRAPRAPEHRGGRRPPSPTGSRFGDPGHRTPSPTGSRFDDPGYTAPRASGPQPQRILGPTRAATQVEQSFNTRVNRDPVPADRRTRPEGVCFNCWRQDHVWRNCPFPCSICGHSGHGRQHCTKRN
jgi:hypothetical protein